MRKHLFTALCIFFSLILFTACNSEGKPSPVGEIITAEQIAGINDDSWNGKLVAVKGYPQFDRKLIKIGEKNYLKISATPDGNKLITANVGVSNADKSERIAITGDKARNFLSISPDNLDITTAKFRTDDYQDVSYQEFLFSGEMVYDDGSYYLENVTIHIP